MKNAKILIADHDDASLSAVERFLKTKGFVTCAVKTGPEALSAFAEFIPDLCIIDPMLSGMDGFTLCQRLTREKPSLPVIISTAVYKGDRYRRDAKAKYGALAYLEKPYGNEKLLETVNSLLGAPNMTSQKSAPTNQSFDELDDTVRDTPSLGATPHLEIPSDLDQVFESAFDSLDLSSSYNKKAPPKPPTGQVFSKPGKGPSPQRKDEGNSMTMRVSPEDLQREMAKIRAELEPTATERSGTQFKKGESDEGESSFSLTSNDIFGSLIDDIESGKVTESEAAPVERKPRGTRLRQRRREEQAEAPAVAAEPITEPLPQVIKVESFEPPPAHVFEPEKVESPYATQPIPPEVKEEAEVKVVAKQDHSKPSMPTTANEYQLLNKIASGGMAEVWKAKLQGEKGFEKIVAIKKILPHLSDNEEFISMFIDEAKVAANLTHPNIAQIYEFGKMVDSFFIAMEYVSGHNMRYILNQCNALKVKVAPEVAAFIGLKLCNALHYAHNKKGYDNKQLNIVHRDVSPQNVLISNEGEIKLVDFGIAKASNKATQTIAGSLKGKLLYMSPEQADGKSLDCRSDIFSLGSVLYEMVVGRKLFSGDSELSILKNVRNAQFIKPREVNPRIPARFEEILLKALTKDPNARYDSAKSMEADLKDYLKDDKVHISEADVADYLRLILNKETEKLEAYGTSHKHAAQVTPAAAAEVAAPAPTKPVVIMPDAETDAGQKKIEPSATEGNTKVVVIAAIVTAVVLILLMLLVFGNKPRANSRLKQAPSIKAQIVTPQAQTRTLRL